MQDRNELRRFFQKALAFDDLSKAISIKDESLFFNLDSWSHMQQEGGRLATTSKLASETAQEQREEAKNNFLKKK